MNTKCIAQNHKVEISKSILTFASASDYEEMDFKKFQPLPLAYFIIKKGWKI